MPNNCNFGNRTEKRRTSCRGCLYYQYGGCSLLQEPVKANDCCDKWESRKKNKKILLYVGCKVR